MSMSLAQGGSGFPYFASCIYDYLRGTSLQNVSVAIEDVADCDIQLFLRKVISITKSDTIKGRALL